LAAGRWYALNFVGIGLIALASTLTYVAPSAAQTSTKDTQASQEEEALDDLLTDEEEIKFKREAPPAGSTGRNQWDDPENSDESPPAPVDPEQIITSPGNVDPTQESLGKEEKHAAQIYVDDEIEKRLARVAGRVPDDEIDHHVVYTPSRAAQKNPSRKALERQLWKQRLAEYKQAKLADRLLNDLEGAGDEQAGGNTPGSADKGPAMRGGSGDRPSGQTGNSQAGSLLERLFGAGGAGGSGQPGATGQSETGAGHDSGADGAASAANRSDRPSEDPNSLDQRDGGVSNGSDEQPLGTVSLGEPPSANQGQSTAFDKFVGESGLAGQQKAALDRANISERAAASQASGASTSTAQSPQSGGGNAASGNGQFSGVPKPKPYPAQPGTVAAAAPAGSSGAGNNASNGGNAGGVANSPASAGTAGSPPGAQNAQAPQGSLPNSPSVPSSGERGEPTPPSPLSDLLAAATAALGRPSQPELPPRDPAPSNQPAAPAQASRPLATDPAQNSETELPDDGERAPASVEPPATADQTGSSGKSFADRFSFSREIEALSPDPKDAPPRVAQSSAAQRTEEVNDRSDAATPEQTQVARLSPGDIVPPPLPPQPVPDPLADPGQADQAPHDPPSVPAQKDGEAEQDRLRRQEFERVAMEKFIAKKSLTAKEQAFIEEAREASLAKSENQVNDQRHRAEDLQNTATGIRKDVAAVVDASDANNKLSYLEPAANADKLDSRAMQAGGQTIKVATNRPSGRANPQVPTRERDVAETQPETASSANSANPRTNANPAAGETIKLFRPEKLKLARPAKDADDRARQPEDPASAKRDLDRQTRQSERLAKKLEREARQETTKVRFDNCVLFIFCSLTKIALPQISPDKPEVGASADPEDGVQRVRP
jgi:hypothetical protein